MNKLPSWFRQDIPDDKTLDLMQLFSEFNLHTVCQEGRCPNITHCFRNKKVTFMILGDTCTRNCKFCGVSKSGTVASLSIDLDEPYRISQVVEILGLKYVVITSVSRDDLSDGGAGIFAETIELIHRLNRDIKVEVLIPDFCGKILCLEYVLDAGPDVVAHNIETVRRLSGELRPQADYQLSLGVLSKIKELNQAIITKSSMMLGLGETEQEAVHTMKDLRDNKCDILTLGQYLAPSVNHYPVKEFISIEQFKKYQDIGLGLGFKSVLSGPLVRSSYQAEEACKELIYV